MDPLISIIVPVYNSEKYLKECVESILSQTYKNIQLILVNDGSTDKSLDICLHYKKIDNRILVIDKENSGVSAARNIGLKYAKGDFIGFVDSDDYIEKNMYEILLNKIINDKSDLCVMTSYTVNESVFKDKMYSPIASFDAIKQLFMLKFPTSLWAYLYTKEVLKDLYLNEKIHFFEDFEYNFRVLLKANLVSLCNDKLYNYRFNEESVNNQQINTKRITCLKIYPIIVDKIQGDLVELKKYIPFFRAHFLISIIICVLKSNIVKERYFIIINQESRKILKSVILSKNISLKYKFVISLCALNSKVLYWITFFKRKNLLFLKSKYNKT